MVKDLLFADVEYDIPKGMAALNITWNRQNGTLEQPVEFDSPDKDILQVATEAVRSGSVKGITADEEVDFTDFVVRRFDATDEMPFARLTVSPKTPFGV